MGVIHLRPSHVPASSDCDRTRDEFVLFHPLKVSITDFVRGLDYAVVIIMGVIIFAGTYWLISAHKWFTGPVRTVEGGSESSSTYDDKQPKMELHTSKSPDE